MYSSELVFIGRWESGREDVLLSLAQQGIVIKIWRSGWNKRFIPAELRKCIQNRTVYSYEYPKAIVASKINLNILSKWAGDTETCRSIEIPACGGFMLAERTERHLEYFVEGKEAEFYSNFEEMLSKVQYYLLHETERKKIAQAGRQRYLLSDYSYRKQMSKALEYLYRENVIRHSE